MTSSPTSQNIVFGFTAIVAGVIVVAALWVLLVDPSTFAPRKDQFQAAVIQTLIPLFTTTAASVVTVVLGHRLAEAWRK